MPHMFPPRVVVIWLLLLLPGVCSAQQLPSVARFPILDSPLGLHGDVRPHQYVGVIGRRAAWLGTETGSAELWVHPFKLVDNFELAFKTPDYVEPIRGADVARTVEVRPELTTITYTHATFTVKEHILAPLEEPGLLVLLDVDAIRPLEIVVSFRMIFQYAWPGGFGGQYTFWDDGARAFVLSESRQQQNGLVGSPWATSASTHPAHALPDAPNTFVIPVDTARAAKELIPIAITAGSAPRDTILAAYRRLIGSVRALYHQRRAHDSTLLAHTTSLDTPEDTLDLAAAWARTDLDDQLVCNPDLGCGLVAGWGPSGRSTRPGFGWFFGGDAAINSFAMDATGAWKPVAEGLRFLAKYQRDDGKMPHEISQAAARIPWFTDFPYPYYHADTTPFWLVAVWRYWRATGDTTLVRELWPAIQKAYRWCLTTDTDGDGLMENSVAGLGAIEVGALGEDIHEDIYLAAVWSESLHAMEELARARGDDSLAANASRLRDRALATLNTRYWRADEGRYAFGILRSGGTNNTLTVWPATAAAFGLLTPDQAERTLRVLATDSISADWGARMVSTGSPLYDPIHYNNGAVWPFVTGFVAWGQYRARRPWSGYPLIAALGQMTFDWARGRHPELLSGAFYRPLDTAVPQQFFATSMLLTPIMYGMLGWVPDAPHHRARLAPQLPPAWSHAAVRTLKVGDVTLDVDFVQGAGRATTTVTARGGPVELTYIQAVPAGARGVQVLVNDKPMSVSPQVGPHDQAVPVTVRLSDNEPVTVAVAWTGGLAVQPPVSALTPGQRSTGLRVLDFRAEGNGWRLEVEGAAQSTYTLDLYGAPVGRVSGGEVTAGQDTRTTLGITFPAGGPRQSKILTLTPR